MLVFVGQVVRALRVYTQTVGFESHSYPLSRVGAEAYKQMYAVIKTGGKQYKVAEGDTLRVEKLDGAEGDAIKLDQVLMVDDGGNVKVGAPVVEGASVSATIKAQGRGEKIKVVKFKRRKDYMRVQGHRQSFTELEITAIAAG